MLFIKKRKLRWERAYIVLHLSQLLLNLLLIYLPLTNLQAMYLKNYANSCQLTL